VLWVMLCMLFNPNRVHWRLCLREELEVPEGIRCVVLCMLEAVEGRLCMLEVIRRVLCMLEAVEGGLCLLEVL